MFKNYSRLLFIFALFWTLNAQAQQGPDDTIVEPNNKPAVLPHKLPHKIPRPAGGKVRPDSPIRNTGPVIPQIDLYTMGPGDDLFSGWGHAAICVTDRVSPMGRCYNYGTTDFQDPWLIWNFLQGKAFFFVSVDPLKRMLRAYEHYDRTVYRQTLELSPAKARQAAKRLSIDALPENREYLYDHLLDNCSTRLRDHINDLSDGGLEATKAPGTQSFRDLLRPGFSRSVPLQAATEFAFARFVDKPNSQWEQMFHPDVLREEVERHFGVKPEVLFTRKAPVPANPVHWGPGLLILVGLVLAASIVLINRIGFLSLNWVLIPLGLTFCFFGIALDFFTVMSKISALSPNEALLIVLPLDFVLVFLRGKKLATYCKFRLLFLLLTLLLSLSGIFIQPLLAPLCFFGLPLAALWYINGGQRT